MSSIFKLQLNKINQNDFITHGLRNLCLKIREYETLKSKTRCIEATHNVTDAKEKKKNNKYFWLRRKKVRESIEITDQNMPDI